MKYLFDCIFYFYVFNSRLIFFNLYFIIFPPNCLFRHFFPITSTHEILIPQIHYICLCAVLYVYLYFILNRVKFCYPSPQRTKFHPLEMIAPLPKMHTSDLLDMICWNRLIVHCLGSRRIILRMNSACSVD